MPTNSDPLKGLLAGALAGLAASVAMSRFHALFANATPATGNEDSTVQAASELTRTVLRHELTPREKELAGPIIHYVFGTSLAALYGAAAEYVPARRTAWGLPFGAAAWLGAHVIAVPALGLSPPITKSTPRAEAVEFAAHLVYGAVTEGLRKLLRMRVLRHQLAH